MPVIKTEPGVVIHGEGYICKVTQQKPMQWKIELQLEAPLGYPLQEHTNLTTTMALSLDVHDPDGDTLSNALHCAALTLQSTAARANQLATEMLYTAG